MDSSGASEAETILAVDDDRLSLNILADVLTAQGYRVLCVDSGELAIAAIEAEAPALILLDVLMPGMSGFELLGWIKRRAASSDIPVIFISALNQTPQRVEGLRLGAVDYISKPFQPEELLARVSTHLELRRLRVRLERRARELQEALEKVKVLSGLIPICASCKQVRDDHGYWSEIELYLRDHSEAEFSHGICPGCRERLYPMCLRK